MPNLNNQASGSAIAFIDTKVENYPSLIAGVTPGTEVVVLDGNRDAIDQITDILGDRSNIDSIHIVSHGAPGSLQYSILEFRLSRSKSTIAVRLANSSQERQRLLAISYQV